MLGGMLAGHKECEGEVENDTMTFYGMSSDDAQLKYYGEKKPHRAAEGKKVQVPYRGSIASATTFATDASAVGSAATIEEGVIYVRGQFVKVNRQLNEVFS